MKFILASNDIKIGFFPEKQPYSSTSVSFVYTNAQEEMVTIRDGQRLNGSELKAGKFNKMYRLDLTPKTLDFKNEFQSMDLVETFIIELSISIQLAEPEFILRNSSQNHAELIKKQLLYTVSEIAKKYPIQQTGRVSNDIEHLQTDTRFVQKIEQLGLRLIDVSANVDLSPKSKEHLERLDQLQKEAQYKQTKVDTDHTLQTKEMRLKTNLRMEEMDGLSQLTESYGLDGLRLALANSDEERAKIIVELQEKKRSEQLEQDKKIQVLIDKGMTKKEIEEILQIGVSQPQNTFNPSAALPNAQAMPEESKRETSEDPLLAGLKELIDQDN